MLRRTSARAIALLIALAVPAAALAHGGHHDADEPWWTWWHSSPEIIGGLLLAGWLYGRGVKRGADDAVWRHVSFYAGLVALAAALLSPIEQLADHVFAIHQVEHMLLRSIGPMLLLLSQPQAALMRGMPEWMRRGVAQPVITNGGVRGVFGFLSQPVVATFLFVAATWFWMWPPAHDIAILNEPIHYLWHVSLLVTGLFFFSVLFDPRAAPAGPRLGTRLAMFWFAAMGNILLGALLSFKTDPLYHAYDVMGRMFGLNPIADEQIGGLTMWIPGCMMFALSALVVLHRWGEEEDRADARRVRMGTAAAHAQARAEQAGRANRALAIGLGSFALVVALIAVTASVYYENELTPSAVAHHGGPDPAVPATDRGQGI